MKMPDVKWRDNDAGFEGWRRVEAAGQQRKQPAHNSPERAQRCTKRGSTQPGLTKKESG
ncbi:MAG: hypothetical protein WBQ64_01710 [Terriglobales bacterium]